MKITLVYNPKAGPSDHRQDDLLEDIRAGGHDVERVKPGDAFVRQCDLVAVAGGDGTVEKVIRHCSGQDVPLAIIPLGTANNIARSLGVEALSREHWLHLVTRDGPRRALSVGRIRGPNLERFFVESVGCGLLTTLIGTGKSKQPDEYDELRFRVRILHRILLDFQPRDYHLVVDGQDMSGSYLLLEIMNIASVGPGLELALNKHPGDGRLAVVAVGTEQRPLLEDYLDRLARGEKAASPFQYRLAQRVDVDCRTSDLHVDDKCMQADTAGHFTVEAGVRQISILN